MDSTKAWSRSARAAALSALAVTALTVMVAGCGKSNPEGFTDTQLQGMDRQEKIVQGAGGDWSKVSEEDKAFLIKGMGSEESAKQYVRNSGGGGKAPAGQYGPPPGGAPVAAPK
jgi:hypothetical protein